MHSISFQTSVGGGQHSSNRVSGISTRTMHQSTTPSLSQAIWLTWASRQFFTLPIVQTLLPVTFGYSLSSEAVVMRQLRRWKRLWRRSLTRSPKRTSMEPCRSCWNGPTSAFLPEEITSKETRVSCVYYQEKCPYEKSLETYLMILVYIYIYIYICVCVCVCMCVCVCVFVYKFIHIYIYICILHGTVHDLGFHAISNRRTEWKPLKESINMVNFCSKSGGYLYVCLSLCIIEW